VLGSTVSREAIDDCCGSQLWRELVAAGLPYATAADLLAASSAAFDELSRVDWLEAFSAHSTIGAVQPGAWTDMREQSGMNGAGDALRTDLAAANLEYQSRFGYVFLVRASGRSGGEMLALLRKRLDNPPDEEFAIACGQEREIVTLRLEGLIAAEAGSSGGAPGGAESGGVR
jgi:OHCU decarboxylase